jgi:hypothetical protein
MESELRSLHRRAGVCRLRDYSRCALTLRAAVGRPAAFMGCAQVVEPAFSYVGGSTECRIGARKAADKFF